MQILHRLSLQQPVMTLEAFLSQVAWPRVQLPSVKWGDTSGTSNDDAAKAEVDDDYIAHITTTHEAWDPGPTKD